MNRKALVMGSFIADSLALGAHWIYDTNKIDQEFDRIETLQQPLPDSFHKNRNKGELTHYGDQTLLLLKSIARHQGFSANEFARDWQRGMEAYDGYLDNATRTTLENIENGNSLTKSGSNSADLGGAARIAPLIFFYHHDPELLLKHVRAQTIITHNNPAVLAGAAALAEISRRVLDGDRPREAIEKTLEIGIADIDLDMKIRAALDSAGKDSRRTIKKFGQACGFPQALPGAVHLIISHENDFKRALIENVMAGGDSAARGLVIGMILGAYLGMPAIPERWLDSFGQKETIETLLTTYVPSS